MILKDRIAIVTGGSKGIGLAVSKRLAADGAHIAIVSRDSVAVGKAVDEVRASGGQAIGVPADCTTRSDVERMVDKVVRELGAPHVLANLVGGAQPEVVLKTSDELFDATINLNVRSAFLLSQAIAPHMMREKRGKIIHTSSIGAKMPSPGLAVYDGCKAFLLAFTRDLAVELGRFNVHVNCVCPGHIPTDGAQDVGVRLAEIAGLPAAKLQEMVAMRMAIPRFPTVDQIAGLYAFLASDDSDCMTGQAINFSSGLETR